MRNGSSLPFTKALLGDGPEETYFTSLAIHQHFDGVDVCIHRRAVFSQAGNIFGECLLSPGLSTILGSYVIQGLFGVDLFYGHVFQFRFSVTEHCAYSWIGIFEFSCPDIGYKYSIRT